MIKIEKTTPLYGVRFVKGFYFESPDDQALVASKPQISLMRLFLTYQEAELYLQAILPYNKDVGRLSVVTTSLDEVADEAKRTNEFSLKVHDAPINVVLSHIAPHSWPMTLEVLLSHKDM